MSKHAVKGTLTSTVSETRGHTAIHSHYLDAHAFKGRALRTGFHARGETAPYHWVANFLSERDLVRLERGTDVRSVACGRTRESGVASYTRRSAGDKVLIVTASDFSSPRGSYSCEPSGLRRERRRESRRVAARAFRTAGGPRGMAYPHAAATAGRACSSIFLDLSLLSYFGDAALARSDAIAVPCSTPSRN